jgi:DNA modification methylase
MRKPSRLWNTGVKYIVPKIITGDVRETLQTLPDGCVQTCVTSPPYFGLRDYGVPGQIGLEASPDAFMARMVDVFEGVRRVLRDDGTLWLNLGDSYATGGKGSGGRFMEMRGGDGSESAGAWAHRKGAKGWRSAPEGLKHKDLIGIPWRVAFALQAAGWYLRADIVWSKPNPMPESVRDRPTKAHEYIFLLSKSPRYYYDAAAIREPFSASTLREFADGYNGSARKAYAGTGAQNASDVKRRIIDKQRGHGRRHAGFNDRWDAMPKTAQTGMGRNKRSVWHVATQPFPGAHFATYPEKLIEPCILAGSKPGDTVFDPFCGSGTTGAVAIRHQRNFIGCEMNPEYVKLAEKRIGGVAPLFSEQSA